MAKKDEEPTGLPEAKAVLRQIASDIDTEGRRIHRITIRLLESGEVTYRLHSREDDHYLGGVTTVDTPA